MESVCYFKSVYRKSHNPEKIFVLRLFKITKNKKQIICYVIGEGEIDRSK